MDTASTGPADAAGPAASPFWALYGRAFLQPRRAFDALVASPARVRYAGYAVAITAAVYQLVYLFLSQNGVQLVFVIFNR